MTHPNEQDPKPDHETARQFWVDVIIIYGAALCILLFINS